MSKLSRSLEAYEKEDGWSSKLFAKRAIPLLKKLAASEVAVEVGRTVIYLTGKQKLKAYVHHNGRSKEFATITDAKGVELATFHYTEFDALERFILEELT